MVQRVCSRCRQTFEPDEACWRCPCGGPLDVVSREFFRRSDLASRPRGLWRYAEALSVAGALPVTLGEPETPLSLWRLDGRDVLLKNESLMPTGSFKDRGSAVLMTHVRSLGMTKVVEDSSGNAGCSVAAYAARAGIEASICVPESTSGGKLQQIRAMGARLVLVPGGRDAAKAYAEQQAESVTYASHTWNPFFLQGTRTLAFELAEQMGWKVPDVVVVPAGNGTLLLGLFKGFSELLEVGITSRIPRLVAVQAAACAPLHRAFEGGVGRDWTGESSQTRAQGIAVACPPRLHQMLEAVGRSGGEVLTVGEPEIRDTLARFASEGLWMEPTSAAGLAGLRKLLPRVGRGESVVGIITGHGWKDPAE